MASMLRSRLFVRLIAPAAIAGALLGAAVLSLFVLRGDAPTSVDVRAPGGLGGLALAEFGPTSDRVFVADPDDPTERRLVATIDHVEGWGINPAFSVAGALAAFTVLPPGSLPRRDQPAELWLLDLDSGEQRRLASDADLLAQPVFDREGRLLVYRSTRADGAQEIVRVDLATRLRRPIYSYRGSFGVFPVGVALGGEVLVASLSATGTDILAVREGAAPRLVVHASDHIARDWRVSPEGGELSYLAPQFLGERWVYRLQVVAIEDGSPIAVNATTLARAEQFGPVWTPDGAAVTVGSEAYPQTSAPATTVSLEGDVQALASPEIGFDVPLGWSPDGAYLVARSFDGFTSYEPGGETIVVISAAGERRPIAAASELIVLGWMHGG